MDYLTNATTKTFAREVLERSRQQLVLVDFWAEWCAPCRALGPILEQAVQARGGRVWLVKVNTDQDPELAQQMGIRGIPAVKAFLDGQLVGELVGVRERREVDAFIDQLLPSTEETLLDQARELLRVGQAQQVPQLLAPLLEKPQHRDEAVMLMARAYARQGQSEQAVAMLERLPQTSLVSDQAAHLRLQLDLLAAGSDGDGELARKVAGTPDDPELRWRLAGWLYGEGRTEEALDQLLDLLQRDRAYREDGARRAILALLDELGPQDPLARSYRRQLQVIL